MNRRRFLNLMGYASAAAALPIAMKSQAEPFIPHEGELLVTVQANGGWDVSSFCDPKLNTDTTLINNWAEGMSWDELPRSGNIPYAPFAANESLFQNFGQYMLVINGIDSQTNSHKTGRIHTWSGRTASGYPSLTSMFAAQTAPNLPVSYINFGGYAETARLIRYSRIDKVGELRQVLEPNKAGSANGRQLSYYPSSDIDLIIQAQQTRLARLKSNNNILPRQAYAMNSYYDAKPYVSALEQFASVIPADSEIESSRTLSQAQIAVLSFKAGVTCAADIEVGGFDTHANHDSLQSSALSNMGELLEYLWNYAEQHGVADRMTVLVGSDFARTPYYNSGFGKNHWPVGSYIIMRKNASWTNRVIGASDADQNAMTINPLTLAPESSNSARVIHPMHVHSALRRQLNLTTGAYPFTNVEEFDFFNPSLG